MASKAIPRNVLVLFLLVLLWDKTTAQSGCTTALIGLSPCLNYVSGNSSTPSSSCCSQLSGVVQSSPQCLCALLNGGSSSLGVTINQTLALALPGACNVQTPPVSQCKAANGPTSSPAVPAGSPVGSPGDETPEAEVPSTEIPSGDGSKTVPSTDGDSSGGSSMKASLSLLGSLIFTASGIWCITGF